MMFSPDWKKRLLFGVALTMATWAACAVQEMFSVYKFGGIDTETNPLFMSDSNTPDSENMVTDTGPGGGPREGFSLFSTSTSSAQAWTFSPSNGTKFHIIREAGTLKATNGSGTYSITVGTVSTNSDTAAAQLGDRFYFMNPTDGLKYWDMSTVTTASTTLQGSILVAYKGRLLASGLAGTPRTIYISKFSDGSTWTAASEEKTEADSVQVGGGLDEKVNGIYSSFNGVAIWFRNSSFGSLDGNRRGGFSIRTFSDVVGSAYPETAEDCDGLFRFLGPRKSVYEWNGSALKRISDPVRTLFGTMAQGDANTRQYLATLKADFDAGTNHQTTNAIVPGNIQMSTAADTDTTTADFSAGTTSNTSVIGDRVYLSTNNANLLNNSFEDGTGFDADSWDQVTLSGTSDRITTDSHCNFSAYDGTYFLCLGGSGPVVKLLDTSLAVLATIGTPSGSSSWTNLTMSEPSYAGRWVYIRVENAVSQYFQTSAPVLFSGSLSLYHRLGTGGYFGFDLLEGGRSTIFSGTLTSAAFNTGFTSAAWLASGANWTTNGNAISAETQSSSDGATWQTAVAWSTGSAPASDFRGQIRYVLTLSTGGTTNGTALPYVDDVTLAAKATFGGWVSEAIALGDISAFGVFSEDTTLDSASVAYAIYTDTNTSITISNGVPVAGSYVSSATVTDSNVPVISTAAYARLASTYTITAGTQEPATHNVAIQWSQGSLLSVPGAWINQRYWLPMAKNSTSNNRVMVYDRRNEWQLYNGINAVWTTVYNGNLLFGNTSGIFTADTGTTDNGTAITAFYKTKDFPLNGVDKKFYLDWIINTTAEDDDTLSTQYFFNGRGTGTSLGDMVMDAEDGFNVLRLNIPTDDATQLMRTVALKFSVTGSTAWKLLMSNLYFQREPVVE